MNRTFTVLNGELVVADVRSGQILWHGTPDGLPVRSVLPVPNSEECIVLLDYAQGPARDFENVIRCRSDGSVVWRAELPVPASNDAYTAVQWADQGLTAYSWSGFSAVLDPATGHIITRTFVK